MAIARFEDLLARGLRGVIDEDENLKIAPSRQRIGPGVPVDIR